MKYLIADCKHFLSDFCRSGCWMSTPVNVKASFNAVPICSLNTDAFSTVLDITCRLCLCFKAWGFSLYNISFLYLTLYHF